MRIVLIRSCLRYCCLILGIVVFCIVLGLGMLGVLWAVLEDEPAKASRWISTLVGEEVQIGSIEARWQGLGPTLHLSEVRIMDPEAKQTLLSFKEAYLGAAPYRSMAAGVPYHFSLRGGQLTVERKAEGCIRIHGLQSRESGCSDSSRIPEWLFKFTRLTLIDVEVEWLDPILEISPLHLHLATLHLLNASDRHRLKGEATLPEDLGKAVAVRAEFAGRGFSDPDSQGTLRLEGKGLQLGRWQKSNFLSELHFTRGTGNLELNLRWGQISAPEIVAKFVWKNVVIAGSAGQVSIPQVAGTARCQRLENGWSAEVPRLFVIGDKGEWPTTALRLKARQDPRPHLQGEVRFLRLQDIAVLFQLSHRVDPKLRRFLAEAQPVGELHRLTFSLPLREGQAAHWKASVMAKRFGLQPWRQWPGSQGLSFALQLTGKGGQLNIHSREVRLVSATLETPVPLDTLRGKITWWHGGKGWQILANNIQAENQDLAFAMALHLRDLPPGGEPQLDLVLTLQRMELAALSRYLSLFASNSNFMGWLGQAFSAGQAVGGDLVFQGPWHGFPFPGEGGRFAADLGIRGATLNYAPGWPALEAVDAYLHSDGQGFIARAIQGRVFNSQVTDAVARIRDLRAKAPPLTVRGQVRGDVGDAWHFIQQSPLRKHYGELLEGMAGGGNARLNLQLQVPLGKKIGPLPLQVVGDVVFTEANLRQRYSPFFELTGIRGNLYFTQGEVKAEGLVAQFLEQPVMVDLQSRANKAGGAGVQFNIRGPMRASRLTEKWLPSLSPWVEGAADFVAEVTFQKALRDGEKRITAQVHSDLKGVQVMLPPPLAKPAGQAQKLAWEIRSTEREKWQIRGTYGEWLYGLFEVKAGMQSRDRLRGEVRVGNEGVALPEQGIRLVGALPKVVSLSAWQKVFSRSLGDAVGGRMPLAHIALQLNRVELWGRHLKEVTVEASQVPSHWQVQVTAPTLQGSIAIPVAGSMNAVDIDLDYLYLDSALGDNISSLADPRGWPAFHFQCRQFKYNGYNLGAIEAQVSGRVNGVHLEQLELVSPAIRIQGRGDWAVHGDTQWSHLDLKAYSPDLSQLLADFGYATNLVGGKTKVEVVFGWPGSPAQLTLTQLSGNMQLAISRGRLLNVEPGAGRLFGLLSISALPRRLALDFSDIFSKGLTFDRIKGDFTLHQGDAFSNTLLMEGPTARIQAHGRIGVADQDYDQLVAVTPNVFSSLPLAGVVAGGPIGLGVGTALMLVDKFVDKLFGAPVGQLITYYYKVSGPWAKPVVARIRRFPSAEE